jgi:LPS export ABC transporter protein LptC
MRVTCFFFILALLGFFWACKGKEDQVEVFSQQDVSIERIQQVDMLYSDSAKLRVRIRGPVMLRHLASDDPRQEFISGIKVDFFNAYGALAGTLTAKYAVRYEYKGVTLVRDSVVWKSIDGKKLESPELTWNERDQQISTNRFVVVTTRTDTIRSHGFTANQDFSNIRFSAVDGSLEVKQ